MENLTLNENNMVTVIQTYTLNKSIHFTWYEKNTLPLANLFCIQLFLNERDHFIFKVDTHKYIEYINLLSLVEFKTYLIKNNVYNYFIKLCKVLSTYKEIDNTKLFILLYDELQSLR
jgi:hypothetical protein